MNIVVQIMPVFWHQLREERANVFQQSRFVFVYGDGRGGMGGINQYKAVADSALFYAVIDLRRNINDVDIITGVQLHDIGINLHHRPLYAPDRRAIITQLFQAA